MGKNKSSLSPMVSAPADPGLMMSGKQKSDASTVMEAHKILSDPKKMKAVHKHLKTQKKSIKSVSDLINFRNAKYGAQTAPTDGSAPSDSRAVTEAGSK